MEQGITFLTYGRKTMGSTWYIAPIRGVCRLYYLHSGSVIYAADGEEMQLTPGVLYLFPQNLEFQLITDESTCVDHTYFDFFVTPALFKQSPLSLVLREYPLIESGFSALAALADTHPYPGVSDTDPYYRLTASYLADFLALIRAEVGLPMVEDTDVATALKYIHDHFNEPISVQSLASHLHVETNVFIRKFKRYTNATPYQYIKNHRVNVALSLIRNKHYTLNEAAEACGYADASALSHAIRSTIKKERPFI